MHKRERPKTHGSLGVGDPKMSQIGVGSIGQLLAALRMHSTNTFEHFFTRCCSQNGAAGRNCAPAGGVRRAV